MKKNYHVCVEVSNGDAPHACGAMPEGMLLAMQKSISLKTVETLSLASVSQVPETKIHKIVKNQI